MSIINLALYYTRHAVLKRHLLSFDTFAMDEVFLRVLDSFWFLLEEHRQWRVTERKIINC